MFGQPDQNPVGMYDTMNASVLRANAEMAARRRAANRFQDAERVNTLARGDEALRDSAFARDMAGRQFTEQGRQFDSRMNVLRELLARRAPDFYGGDAPAAQSSGFAATVGGSGSGGGMDGGGFRFNMRRGGGGDGQFLQNYLMRYLRG